MSGNAVLATMARMGRDASLYLIFPSWLAAVVLLFAEASPANASTTFRVAFLGFIMLPAAFNVIILTMFGLEKTNDAVAESKIVSNAALLGLVPAAVLLPMAYWLVYVLAGILFVQRLVIEIRLRTVNPTRKVVSLQTSSASQEGDEEEGERGGGFTYEAVPAEHTLDDLAGMEELKAQLLAAAKEASRVVKAKGKKGLRANNRNGILLHSEPGNGKTVLAEGVAGSLGLPIIKISFGDLASKWVNNTTENVVQMFRDARAQAPCILFLDEVDSVIADRNSGGSSEEGPKTTNQILTDLVASRGSGVVVMMATNFLDRLDAAAIREGRVDFKIEVPPPDAAARRAIIIGALKKAGASFDPGAIDQAVKRWEGFSASRISSVADQAARQGKGRKLRYDDLQEALRFMQGSLGERISESTPLLSELHMPEQQRKSLVGIAKRMESIEEIEDLGGSVPSGVLLAGPPGTGKTLAIRSLAKTTGWPLLTSSGVDLMNDAKNIDKLISKAKNARPCIVFIDEADDVFSNRRMGSSYSASITNKLLTAMDGAGGKAHDILWAAAVNAPESMDPAALRGGRFTEKVWFDNPDADTAERIVLQWMGKSKARFETNLTAERIASVLDGESPANIQAVLQQAVNNMIARTLEGGSTNRVVTHDDLEAAKTAVIG